MQHDAGWKVTYQNKQFAGNCKEIVAWWRFFFWNNFCWKMIHSAHFLAIWHTLKGRLLEKNSGLFLTWRSPRSTLIIDAQECNKHDKRKLTPLLTGIHAAWHLYLVNLFYAPLYSIRRLIVNWSENKHPLLINHAEIWPHLSKSFTLRNFIFYNLLFWDIFLIRNLYFGLKW